MLGLIRRRVPDRNDLIADVLVDGPVPLENQGAHLVQVLLDHLEDVLSGHRLGHRCEPADVYEQQAELAPITFRGHVLDRAGVSQLS